MSSPLVVITASIDPERTREFWGGWQELCTLKTHLIMVVNSPEITRAEGVEVAPSDGDRQGIFEVRYPGVLGPVKAFKLGIEIASKVSPLIACLHDDVTLFERGWDERIVQHFDRKPACTLAGYSGCEGLGSPEIYMTPKHLHQLARQGFFSNMVDAESHGRRASLPALSACADGFSQIGRAAFLRRAFEYIESKGVAHHAYDSWLGMLAWRWGGECWFLPEKVAHAGGRTAVLAEEYHKFAESRGGDQGLWQAAHEALYEDGRGFLPFRVGDPS